MASNDCQHGRWKEKKTFPDNNLDEKKKKKNALLLVFNMISKSPRLLNLSLPL